MFCLFSVVSEFGPFRCWDLVFGGGSVRDPAVEVAAFRSLVSVCCLSLFLFRRPGSGAQLLAAVATLGVVVDGKGGPGCSQGMCFHGIAPYRSEACGRQFSIWLVGGDSGPLIRIVWASSLRAIPYTEGAVWFCLVLICCLAVIPNGAVHLVPYAAQPFEAFCMKAKKTLDNGVSAYCKMTRVATFVTIQARSGCNSV